ncbi:type I restriction-modification system, S subunit [Streptococcus pneumoniae]|nr:type I restriction-modification system, S subunit [Streptococcus pneumoniae]
MVEIVRGGSPRPIKDYLTSEVDGINWIKIGDTEKGEKYINNVKEKIKKSGLNKTRFVKKGTFLLTNSMSFGRPYILNVDGAIHDGWLAISNYENSLNKDYLFYILSSNVVYSQFLSLISGAVVKNLNSDKVASILIPLPPLSEQQRIIEAIESALEKVDEYAESYNRLEQLDKEFPDKLKKSILQYAMQGKLVEQDPNDESVEVLLEKIRAEKQKLFEEGKIKKKDLDISIVSQGDDNSYYGNKDETTSYPIYEIPEAWRYIKFASLVNFRIGKTPPRSEATFWGTEIPWVSISDMPISGYVTNTRESISKLALKSKKIDISPKGTLLMSFKLSIGKVAILDIPATHNEAIISIFPYANKENIIRDYLMIFLPLISTLGDQLLLFHFQNKDPEKFFGLIEDNLKQVHPIFQTVFKTFLKNKEKIVNALQLPYSNAKLEATNNLIKLIKRNAFGFRNFENFKKRIFIALNIKKERTKFVLSRA